MITPARRVYIAGPMEGYENYNFAAFDKAMEYVREAGDIPVCPSALDRAIWSFDGSGDHRDTPGMTRLAVLRIDLQIVCTCEAIHLLRGWEKSSGAIAEYALAKTLGLDVTFQKGAVQGDVGCIPTAKSRLLQTTEAEDKLWDLQKYWREYKKYLMLKYPAVEGQQWEFTCEHHKLMDEILKEE